MNPRSLDVDREGGETLLAGVGLKNLFRFSEYELGTFYTFLCKNQPSFFAISSMVKVHPIDISSKVGAFGFR